MMFSGMGGASGFTGGTFTVRLPAQEKNNTAVMASATAKAVFFILNVHTSKWYLAVS
jgi:hypothetical protein